MEHFLTHSLQHLPRACRSSIKTSENVTIFGSVASAASHIPFLV
eukprot:06481.XXX_111448_111579_1 [CDS] Oithona nana genome sequencing.